MKLTKTIILNLLVLVPFALSAKKDGMAHFSGTIADYHQGSLITITDPQGKVADDTLQLGNDGSFNTAINVQYPTELIFNIEQPQASFKIYATQNSEAKMSISFKTSNDKDYEAVVNYEGDNKEVFNFMQSHDYNNLIGEKYSDEAIKKMTFSEYQKGLRDDINKMETDLVPLKDKVFKAAKQAEWEKKYTYELMRYSVAETKEDADFTAWWQKQDINNDQSLASGAVARYYHLAQESGDNNYEVNFIKDLPRKFSNKDVYYAAANEHIVNVLAKAPVNTDEIYSAYKKLYAGHENDIPDYVKASYEEAKQNVAGKAAPDFEMEDANGNKLTLSSLKGKLLYIDVWATWCGPCKIEIPNMVKLSEHYKDDANVQLISISIDQDADRWKQVMSTTEKKDNWSQYHVTGALESDFCKRYNIVGIPRFIIIDRDGKVVSLDAPRPGEPGAIEMIDKN